MEAFTDIEIVLIRHEQVVGEEEQLLPMLLPEKLPVIKY